MVFDLSGRAELEPEIGPEVTPLVGVKTSSQIEPLVFDKIDGSEALVTESFFSKFLEAARVTVVIQRRVRLKQRGHACLSPFCGASMAALTVEFNNLSMSICNLLGTTPTLARDQSGHWAVSSR